MQSRWNAVVLLLPFIVVVTCTENWEKCVKFKYYNKENEAGAKIDVSTIKENNSLLRIWKIGRSLKIITHGWNADMRRSLVKKIKNAYIEGYEYNIITVDWFECIIFKTYPLIMKNGVIEKIGKKVATLIDNLIKNTLIKFSDIHLIGHSLGAHIMGAAGRQSSGNEKVGRITGLDPAGVIFESNKTWREHILTKNDSHYVDVIHSSTFGIRESIGHVDFFPNGIDGFQPRCGFDMCCKHARAIRYYFEAVKYPGTFIAWKCDSWEEFRNGGCDDNNTICMGDETPTNAAEGNYYFFTNEKSPFGKGDSGKVPSPRKYSKLKTLVKTFTPFEKGDSGKVPAPRKYSKLKTLVKTFTGKNVQRNPS